MTRLEARPGREGWSGKRKSGSSRRPATPPPSIPFATLPPAPKTHPWKNKAASQRRVPHIPPRSTTTRFFRSGWYPTISSTPHVPQNAATIYPAQQFCFRIRKFYVVLSEIGFRIGNRLAPTPTHFSPKAWAQLPSRANGRPPLKTQRQSLTQAQAWPMPEPAAGCPQKMWTTAPR